MPPIIREAVSRTLSKGVHENVRDLSRGGEAGGLVLDLRLTVDFSNIHCASPRGC